MSTRDVGVLALIALCGFVVASAALGRETAARNIFEVPLPEKQTRPMTILCSPTDSVMIQVPYPITGWAGRGFLPEGVAEQVGDTVANSALAGDYTIFPGDLRGYTEFVITARVREANRTLHLIMRDGERTHVLTLECLVAPNREQAFRRVVFTDLKAADRAAEQAVAKARQATAAVTVTEDPPESIYVAPTPETIKGLRDFARTLAGVHEDRALAMISANPAMQLANKANVPEQDVGAFSIQQRFAVRDAMTDTLALVVTVRSKSKLRLLFDPRSWVLRAGSRVYPVNLVDFSGALEPEASALVVLVLARDQAGNPTRLLPESEFRPSVALVSKESTKPVDFFPFQTEDFKDAR